jgi:hypothetical protein
MTDLQTPTTKLFALRMSNGGYMIELPKGHHRIDGVEKYLVGDVATFDELPELEKISVKYLTTHYFNANGDQLSVDDYNKKLDELKSKGYYIDDCLEFLNLDDEYAFKKFSKEWVANQVIKTIVETRYEFEVIPEIKSSSVHIVPMRHFGKDLTKNAFVLYRYAAAEAAFYEFAKKYGYEIVSKNSEPKKNECQMGYNGFRYAKIGKSFIFSDSDVTKFNSNFVGDYDSCEKTMQSDRDYIEQKFLLEVNANKKFEDETTIKTILDKVESIRTMFRNIDYKNASRHQYGATQNAISELSRILTELITKK